MCFEFGKSGSSKMIRDNNRNSLLSKLFSNSKIISSERNFFNRTTCVISATSGGSLDCACTWVWANSRRQWRAGKPGVLQSMGWQRIGHNWATERLNNNKCWVTQSCLTLCDLMDCSPPGSCVRGISQARTLEWVVTSSSREFFWPGIKSASPESSALVGRFFTAPPGKP